jgi:hypothetical protein
MYVKYNQNKNNPGLATGTPQRFNILAYVLSGPEIFMETRP